ncbi:trehalose-phosphatase [Candidatus Methanoperedens nitroreducens]|uniref:Trehalose-phosphatase n=1 Tax=Candidatus Methanoperedens nitratireducens TaxID=1392998 RepID=A0A062V5K9_9EURY|nr:bifunctional alpha,alpha-trehalose-phosphate synthase (UDP-forming)/trehalose-phosphatase [Candidatus Methanoperedens nitroreducens]KCZ71868.1 trehalose-phosphatase [Candidatus Methanoperedens nitroreducens]MDJ1422158.1 bifunctional alpha,alpha-trehalose-phosphate synthase (UDP-forming)/trehalose-phosphatase [Candidatus Methanoperedens sp.]
MRILIVSNRLPITVVEKEGGLKFRESVGGLVSGLSAYMDSLKNSSFTMSECIWIGWPGITIDDNNGMKEELKSRALSEFHSYPVFLSKKSMEKFYHGFCNKTIWPLFHYFPTYAVYDEDYWEYYKHVNEVFCDAIMEIIRPDDVVWVHDYHLMLLPKLIRDRMPNNPVGFFLHIPFPSFEIFRLLPKRWKVEILEGILGADLVGFHTHEYTQYFLRCVLRILGHEHTMGKIIQRDHIVKADTFPMGIQFTKFNNAASSLEVQNKKDVLKNTLADYKIILSIDRLDYTKGLINRLQCYELFLEMNKQWHRKVILILVIVPSRVGVEHYQQMKKEIDELVGRINGRFGDIEWTPILYLYRFLPFSSLVTLYTVSDVALITPLRDGMNLIAKEYLAARTDGTGVLILSEMAGASKELGEAIIINPNNKEEVADALCVALEMPHEEQVKRNKVMQDRLSRYDVVGWADDFVNNLLQSREEQIRSEGRLLRTNIMEQMIKDFKKARRGIIFLDYDGTLAPFAPSPRMAKPDEEILKILRCLSEISKIEVVLISGRDKDTLQEWFGMLNINLVAEHGIWIREIDEDWKMIKPLRNGWKAQILPILKMYVDRVPGASIEEKDFSIAWHYRKADSEQGSLRAKELIDALVNFTANIDVQVLQGSKVVEIRNAGVNKGNAGLYWISKNNCDFVLGIGDDLTDEDLFRALPEAAYSIKVGMSQSCARFNVHSYMDVLGLLEQLARTSLIKPNPQQR